MTADPIVILSYARTPMGSFQGALSSLKATDLGAAAVKAAMERAKVSGDKIDRIYMGCVLPAGLGQAPARQAALGAGLPESVEATTIHSNQQNQKFVFREIYRVCGILFTFSIAFRCSHC